MPSVTTIQRNNHSLTWAVGISMSEEQLEHVTYSHLNPGPAIELKIHQGTKSF